ncbi:MAG: IclR family transcriptional regulator [Verrucomicrobiae bacterium]|nr:IclR family transcriptional regulator [Verrucomicrobiae bacterium]
MHTAPAAPAVPDYDLLPSPTTAKTLAVLDLLAQHPGGLSATESARHTGFTPNLVFRILKTLVLMGYAAQREDDKTYTLSNRLLDLSRPKANGKSLVVSAQGALRELRDDTGETVQLLIESGGKMLVMEQLQGTHALQVCGQVGMRIPLYSCAPGKAILAWWGAKKRAEWFRGRALKSFTANTLSKRKDLERELELARLRGYTVDREEGIEGIRCVAATVCDEFGNPLAAITVMAPMSRLPEDLFEKLGQRVMQAARAIEKEVRL